MLLEVIAYWIPEGINPEEEETLGRKIQMEKDVLIINTDHIVGIHSHSSGEAMIRLTNGDVFRLTEKFEKFKEVIFGEQVARDMMVSGDN